MMTTQVPKLPAGARGILPTVWATFVVTVLLALIFSFANVWDLGRRLGIEPHVAPLIGPAVDLTAAGLLVVVPWFVLAGVDTHRLKGATKLMALAGTLTLALNSAPAAITGWTRSDPKAWGRAAVEAIVPLLLIAWSHVGPTLVALFAEVRGRHLERVEALRRAAVEDSTEAARRRHDEIAEAVDEALRGASTEWDARLTEARREASAEAVAALAEARDSDARHVRELEAALASEQRIAAELDASTEEVRRLRERLAGGSAKTPRARSTKTAAGSAEPVKPIPRKTAAELLEERVDAAKEALPMWQIETPSGPEIRSALGIKSDGVISDIRKRLDADRLTLANREATG
jgi:hypothetical protein